MASSIMWVCGWSEHVRKPHHCDADGVNPYRLIRSTLMSKAQKYTHTAWLGLGSNLGNRIANLSQATARLSELQDTVVSRTSRVYATEPVGPVEQGSFLNAVVEVQTTLDPLSLLRACQHIEQQLGRVRAERWGPRTLDIDILAGMYPNMNTDALTLPHPEAHTRGFVLQPLRELAPELVLDGRSVAQWADIVGTKGVTLTTDTLR